MLGYVLSCRRSAELPSKETGKAMSNKAAIIAVKSGNSKIKSARGKGEVATTYASIKASCPESCELRTSGTCYAQNGMVGFTVRRLDAATDGHAPLETAITEAAAIDAAFKGGAVPQDGAKGGRDLRLHTSGDCSTVEAAEIVGAAASRWAARSGGDVWTYTHAWRDVPRSAWGKDVSVLASVDNTADVAAAQAQGYTPARYVAEFPSAKGWVEAGVRWVACPAQTRDDMGCADCRLCMDADALKARNVGIAFSAHGTRANALKRRLQTGDYNVWRAVNTNVPRPDSNAV
jgi:hypothetical protein